jgi:hypothetical protein
MTGEWNNTIIQKIKPYDWSKTMMNEIITYNTTSRRSVYLTLAKSGIRWTIQQTKLIFF